MSAGYVSQLGTEELCRWLRHNSELKQSKLEAALKVIVAQEIEGANFLTLTKADWMAVGLALGVADSLFRIAKGVLESVAEVVIESPQAEGAEDVHPNRRRRWAALNEAIEEVRLKKQKTSASDKQKNFTYVAYFSLTWDVVGPVFRAEISKYVQTVVPNPQEDMNTLTTILGGPGWLSGCKLLSHKVQSAGSNSRKVNGFLIPDSHLSEISDYDS